MMITIKSATVIHKSISFASFQYIENKCSQTYLVTTFPFLSDNFPIGLYPQSFTSYISIQPLDLIFDIIILLFDNFNVNNIILTFL